MRKTTQPMLGPALALPQLVTRITSQKVVGEIQLCKSVFNDILET